MRSIYIVLVILTSITFWSCGDKTPDKPKNPLVDMIENPVSAHGEIDSSKVAQIYAEQYLHTFDTVSEGSVVEHTFFFVNKGKQPLKIFDARSKCGCTVAEYSDDLVESAKRGFVKISFNTDTKTGFQERPIDLYSNTLPQKTTFMLSGYVTPNKD